MTRARRVSGKEQRHMVIQQLKRQVKRLLGGGAPPASVPSPSPTVTAPPKVRPPLTPPPDKRFLSNQPRRTAAFLQAAKDYVGKLPEMNYAYLYEKPFDRLAGPPSDSAELHTLFYQELYQVMN